MDRILPLRGTVLFLLLFFYVTAATVAQRNFFYIAPAALFLLGLPCLKDAAAFSRRRLAVPAAMSVYVAGGLLMCAVHGGRIAAVKTDAALLLVLPLIFLLARLRFSLSRLMVIFAAASAVLGAVAVYDRYILGLPRALIERQPIIPAGGVAMVLGIFCLCYAFFAVQQGKNKTAAVYLLASAGGIVCSILTGSRGTWLCLPPVLLWLVWQYRKNLRGGLWLGAAVFLAVLFFVMLPESGVMTRFREGFADLRQYFSGGGRDTSWGLRLQFWQSAWDGFRQKPLLGWGFGENYLALKKMQHTQGLISAAAVPFTHAHNQFLDNAVKQGIVGVAALAVLLVLPWRFFSRAARAASSPQQRFGAQCGQVLLFCCLTFCLSDIFLGLALGMVFFAVSLAVFTGFCLQDTRNG